MPRCNSDHSFTNTLPMPKEPVTSNRDSSCCEQIHQKSDLPVECIKLKTVFFAYASVADHREPQVLHSSVTRLGPRHTKQAECLRPLAHICAVGGGPEGALQACLVDASSLLWSLLCWKAFLNP